MTKAKCRMKSQSQNSIDECSGRGNERKRMPELWQVVVECRDEAEQREVYERMKAEGRRVRLHVL